MVRKIRTRDSQLRFRMIKESLFDDSSNETEERKGKKKEKHGSENDRYVVGRGSRAFSPFSAVPNVLPKASLSPSSVVRIDIDHDEGRKDAFEIRAPNSRKQRWRNGEQRAETERKIVRACVRAETSHQLKRTRFDGVAENNGRIGVQFRGGGRWGDRRRGKGSTFCALESCRPLGEVFGGAGRGRGFGVGGWMHVKSKTLILKHSPANGALNSKQYNERGNVACCRAFLFPFFSILPPRQLFLAFTCLPWDAYTHACDRTMN